METVIKYKQIQTLVTTRQQKLLCPLDVTSKTINTYMAE